MAYRTRDMLELKEDRYNALGSIVHLNNPVLMDWNIDGQIFEGWVLERIDNVLTQVIQVWWVSEQHTTDRCTSVESVDMILRHACARNGWSAEPVPVALLQGGTSWRK